jgi:hypothetical protein
MHEGNWKLHGDWVIPKDLLSPIGPTKRKDLDGKVLHLGNVNGNFC